MSGIAIINAYAFEIFIQTGSVASLSRSHDIFVFQPNLFLAATEMIGDSESWKIYYEGTGLDGFSALFIDQNFMIALSTSTFIQSGLYAVQEIGTESIIQTKPRKAFFLIMNRAKWHHIITLQACLR